MNLQAKNGKSCFWKWFVAVKRKHCGQVSQRPQTTQEEFQIVQAKGIEKWVRMVAIAIATIVAVIVVAIF